MSLKREQKYKDNDDDKPERNDIGSNGRSNEAVLLLDLDSMMTCLSLKATTTEIRRVGRQAEGEEGEIEEEKLE